MKMQSIHKYCLFITVLNSPKCENKTFVNTYALFRHLPLKPSPSLPGRTPKLFENLLPPESPTDKDDQVTGIFSGLYQLIHFDSDKTSL